MKLLLKFFSFTAQAVNSSSTFSSIKWLSLVHVSHKDLLRSQIEIDRPRHSQEDVNS